MKSNSSSSHLIVMLLLPFFIIITSDYYVGAKPPTTNIIEESWSSSSSMVQCLIKTHSSQNSSSQQQHPISDAVFLPSNSSFDSVLYSYIRNTRFAGPTTPKPKLIVAAQHASHVSATVICAKTHRLELRIRSGGHDYEGLSSFSYYSPFVILDMNKLRAVHVSVETETAWVEAGATLGELYYQISRKSDAYAFPGGTCPSVGVGGQVGGGGIGNLIRKYGTAADNVVDAVVVDAYGRVLDRKSMGEDLFWAVTGGGASSFAVVVSYKVRLVRVPSKVTFAGIRRFYDEGLAGILHKYFRVVDNLDRDLYVKVVLGSVKERTVRATFQILFLGGSEGLLGVMNRSFPELGLGKDDCYESSWAESLVRWDDFPSGTNTSALTSRVFPRRLRMKRKSDILKKPISRQGLELIFKKLLELKTPVLKFLPLGGFSSEISESDKPFPHRAGNIAVVEIATSWEEAGDAWASYYVNLTREFYDFLAPFVSENREAYLNYRDIDLGIINRHDGPNSYEEGAAYGLKYFKSNFYRLVEIKSRYDPENFFRNEQSIPVLRSVESW